MDIFEKVMKQKNENNDFITHMGINITEFRSGFARGEMKIKEWHNNPLGSLHGGVIYSLADNVGAAVSISRGMKMTTISSDFHYLLPGINGEKVYAVAREIKNGKKVSVVDVEIYDDWDRMIAKGTFSYFNLGVPIETEQ